jgi:hypothetical protein
MRNLIAIVLLPAVLAQGCASTAASYPNSSPARSAGQPRAADPAKLQEISEDLAGDSATVELTSGEVVQKAQSVRLGTEVTSWREASGRERSVPTAEVRRVLREQRHLIGRGFGYGATAAILPAYFVANNAGCHKGCGEEPFSGAAPFVAGLLVVVAGGLVGMVVAAGNRHPVVVYAGPPAGGAASTPGSSTPGSSTHLQCRLSSSASGDRLDCGPLTR